MEEEDAEGLIQRLYLGSELFTSISDDFQA